MSTRPVVAVSVALALVACGAARANRDAVPVAATPLPASGLDAASDAPLALLPRPPDPKESRFDVDAGLVKAFGAFAITHEQDGTQGVFDLPAPFMKCATASAVYIRFERAEAGSVALQPTVREGPSGAVDCVLKRAEKHTLPGIPYEADLVAKEIYVVPPATR